MPMHVPYQAEWFEPVVERLEAWLRSYRYGVLAAFVTSVVALAARLYPSIRAKAPSSRPTLNAVNRSVSQPTPVPNPVRDRIVGDAHRHNSWKHAKRYPRKAGGSDRQRVGTTREQKPAAQAAAPVPDKIHVWVHVAGAVRRPGVVRLRAGCRRFQAVQAAGGLLPGADLTRVNLAKVVIDEDMLIIPESLGQSPDKPMEEFPPSAQPHPASRRASEQPPVDINQATYQQLQQLPGVGQALAHAIVEWRLLHGPYRRPEDLLLVRHFGPKLLLRIRPHITIVSSP